MPGPLIYVDTSSVREGALEELREGIAELARFVELNEPELLSYSVYFSEDGGTMVVTHVHADPASLDVHMEVAGPRFARFTELVTLRSIHVYGEPSAEAVAALHRKAALLGTQEVRIHPPHAGFLRRSRA